MLLLEGRTVALGMLTGTPGKLETAKESFPLLPSCFILLVLFLVELKKIQLAKGKCSLHSSNPTVTHLNTE